MQCPLCYCSRWNVQGLFLSPHVCPTCFLSPWDNALLSANTTSTAIWTRISTGLSGSSYITDGRPRVEQGRNALPYVIHGLSIKFYAFLRTFVTGTKYKFSKLNIFWACSASRKRAYPDVSSHQQGQPAVLTGSSVVYGKVDRSRALSSANVPNSSVFDVSLIA